MEQNPTTTDLATHQSNSQSVPLEHPVPTNSQLVVQSEIVVTHLNSCPKPLRDLIYFVDSRFQVDIPRVFGPIVRQLLKQLTIEEATAFGLVYPDTLWFSTATHYKAISEITEVLTPCFQTPRHFHTQRTYLHKEPSFPRRELIRITSDIPIGELNWLTTLLRLPDGDQYIGDNVTRCFAVTRGFLKTWTLREAKVVLGQFSLVFRPHLYPRFIGDWAVFKPEDELVVIKGGPTRPKNYIFTILNFSKLHKQLNNQNGTSYDTFYNEYVRTRDEDLEQITRVRDLQLTWALFYGMENTPYLEDPKYYGDWHHLRQIYHVLRPKPEEAPPVSVSKHMEYAED